jgi:predicted RNA-binding Zn-ribbon protein involved in translation (DUF1610 family)
MAEPVRAGNDVSAGTYTCTSCGYPLDLKSRKHLPLCPFCHNEYWQGCHPSELASDPNPKIPTADENLQR